MIFYFVRHGESTANVEKIVSNRGFQHPLTTVGEQQVLALAESWNDIEISHIYTSPLQRAIQTAEIIGQSQHIQYEVVDALREGDCGILEGRGDDECWTKLVELANTWFEQGDSDAKIEGGESYNDIIHRFVPFVEGLINSHSQSDSIALISHGATLTVSLPHVLDNIDVEYAMNQSIDNACYIKAEQTVVGLVCLEWCGTSVTE